MLFSLISVPCQLQSLNFRGYLFSRKVNFSACFCWPLAVADLFPPPYFQCLLWLCPPSRLLASTYGMRFRHPRRTTLSSEIFCPFWEKEGEICCVLAAAAINLHSKKLSASCGLETQPRGRCFFPCRWAKLLLFLVGFAPICVRTFDFTRFCVRRISVFVNECLKILLVKAVLVCKTVEFCDHSVMLVLNSQWLPFWVSAITTIWIPAIVFINKQSCHFQCPGYAAFCIWLRGLTVHW